MSMTHPSSQQHSAGEGEILTYSGVYVTPLDLKIETIQMVDIAHALSNQCRYSGHVREFYSVAEHSVRVSWQLGNMGHGPDVRMQGLLHDAQEAYLQDVARPLKEDSDFGRLYREAEGRAELVIAEKFDIAYPWHPDVKLADLQLLGAERRDLMPQVGVWDILDGVEIPEQQITPWTPTGAKLAFQEEFFFLSTQRRQERG